MTSTGASFTNATPTIGAITVNVNVGRNNYDTIRVSSISADSIAAMEGFKAGHIHLRQENNSKSWATAMIFPPSRTVLWSSG